MALDDRARVSVRVECSIECAWWVEVVLPGEFDQTGWLSSACFHVPCAGSRDEAIAKLRRIAEAVLSVPIEECSIIDDIVRETAQHGPIGPVPF